MNKQRKVVITTTYNEMGIIIDTKTEEVAQPNLQPACNQLATDCISRQAAISAFADMRDGYPKCTGEVYSDVDICKVLTELPSSQPTLYGYDIEHLKLIANVLREENLPPEKVADALMDIGRIVAIIRDEFEETLRKVVQR